MDISRRCVPYTPMWKSLSQMKIALVSTAGIHLKSQEPYNAESDESFRILTGDFTAADLAITHGHYDHSEADIDPNVMFPIDRLRELAAEGFIGGVANKHVAMMGYSMKLKQVYEETLPAIAKEINRSNADAVILTAG
jgi:D-proline reductase (dithiol) PrdB